MENLKDIQGLDSISSWPLALGWWLVLFIFAGLVLVAACFFYKLYKYRKSWQYKSFKTLDQIEKSLQKHDTYDNKFLHTQLHELCVEIRRVAISGSHREVCAGLTGMRWLEWLRSNDPQSFDWPQHAQIIIQAQYMPQQLSYDVIQLKKIIKAIKAWVQSC